MHSNAVRQRRSKARCSTSPSCGIVSCAHAEALYKYKPRSEKYLWRKRRKKHHQHPLVWTGRTRQQSSALYTITGTSRRVRGRMSLPWYVKMKPLRRNAPALGEELTRVTTREHRYLVTHLDKNVTRALNGLKARKVVRV